MTRRMSVRLALVLEQLEGDVVACKKAKKSKNLPRGDYLEFVRLVSVCFIVAMRIILIDNVHSHFCSANMKTFLFTIPFRFAKDLYGFNLF